MLQIFTLEHSVLLHNVLTRFSQFQFFVTLLPLRNIFPAHLSMYITILFFNRKIKVFFTNCWNRFLKYGSITQIYETFWKCLNTSSRFSISNHYYTSRKTNFKKLFQQFLDKRFFFILKQSLTFLMVLGIWKMFRGKSPVFKTKFRRIPQLQEMVGSNFFYTLVWQLFIVPEVLNETSFTV